MIPSGTLTVIVHNVISSQFFHMPLLLLPKHKDTLLISSCQMAVEVIVEVGHLW